MEVFVKSFDSYRTIKHATTLSASCVLDSLTAENSPVVVRGNDINLTDVGNWLVADGTVYRISQVTPGQVITTMTLTSPLEAFNRPLELQTLPAEASVGAFISSALWSEWVSCEDPAYAMPYLVVSNLDTTLFVSPDLDNAGMFRLPDYCRLMRKSNRVQVAFLDAGSMLQCVIKKETPQSRKISFSDGRSQLVSVVYAASGLAKITAINDVKTAEKDEDGSFIYRRDRTVWYLSEDGDVSQTVPERRAAGGWGSVYIRGTGDVYTKVQEAFAAQKTGHKVEFWSSLDLAVLTDCTYEINGEVFRSFISHKRKDSGDRRFYYKTGDLATTITEKLKGVIK